jgi:hypothetical protein
VVSFRLASYLTLWHIFKKMCINVFTPVEELARDETSSFVKFSRSTEHWMTGKSSTNTPSL